MSAKDYEVVTGFMRAYFAKKKKRISNTMSQDRREITPNEIMGLFEFYLRQYCERNNTDTIIVADGDGNKLYEAKLYDLPQKADA